MAEEAKAGEKPLNAWTFLNSSFGLWLFSAIFITGAGSAFTYFQAQTAEAKKNKEHIEKLDLEISYRYSEFFNRVYELTNMKNDPSLFKLKEGKTANDVLKLYSALREPSPTTLGFLYPEFRNLGLLALKAELRRLVSEKQQRDQIDRSIASISSSIIYENIDFANVTKVGRSVNSGMAHRWKEMRFAFIDCPSDLPFC